MQRLMEAHNRRFGVVVIIAGVFATAAAPGAAAQKTQTVVDIGSRRELFVDRHLIDTLTGCRLELHHPRRQSVALKFDKPWEGLHSGYITVIKDGPLYRMYYRGLPKAGRDGSAAEVTTCAQSKDGITWTKPKLGIYEVGGTKENNVVLAGSAPLSHNFTPFLDNRPGAAAAQRYKALGGTERSGLVAFVSPDGLHWKKLQDKPVITKGKFDSQNVAFWSQSEGRYVCYFRTWSGGGWSGFRTISRTTSKDFIHWSQPVAMTFGNTPMEHLYTNATQPYFRAPHIYVALPQRFFPARGAVPAEQAKALVANAAYRRNCSDVALMTSRGGNAYDRTFMEGFILPGPGARDWISRNNMAATGIVPANDGRNLFMYRLSHYGQPTCHVMRYSLRLDGFVSVRAPYKGGELVTRGLKFAGGQLEINFATSAGGSVRVEIQDAAGTAIPGYTLADCPDIVGDRIAGVVRWKGGSDVSKLAGKEVRLRFVMKDAHLYALRFVAPGGEKKAKLVSVERIWDKAPHNAFTDLVRFRNQWFCVFREGKGHVSPDGALRVITSTDGKKWTSAARIESKTADLRDAKITVTPKGQLMLSGAAALHQPAKTRHQSLVWFSDDGSKWSNAVQVGDKDMWLWRVTWRKDTAYGIGYSTTGKNIIRLYTSADGRKFKTLVKDLGVGDYPNETSIVFQADGAAVCLLRRDGGPRTAKVGTAKPPYTKWTWKDLGVQIGGPHLLQLPDGRFIAAVRLYKPARTALCWLDPQAGKLTKFLTLPSGGDTSYAGLVWHEGLLWMSYYSSHKGKTSIYLAKIKLPGS